MKEHKIEILCQMEYEDWQKEIEEAGPGWKPLFNAGAQVNIQSGLGGGLSGLLGAFGSGLLGQYRTKCFYCGK